MTLDEFLAELSRTPRDWKTRCHEEFIRSPSCCPITAVTQQVTGMFFYEVDVERAGEAIALDPELRHQIVAAADGEDDADPNLRERLLAACGLSRALAGVLG